MTDVFEEVLSDISADQRDLMRRHWELVKAWNKRTNLTSIVSDKDAVLDHYLDSIAISKFLKGTTVDMGSGGGFPGIPLAIIGIPITMVEPRNKRVSFLRTSAARLKLDVEIICGRSTDNPPREFDHVTTRATFSDVGDLKACLNWIKPGGTLVAMRSQPSGDPEAESHSFRVGPRTRWVDIWTKPSE